MHQSYVVFLNLVSSQIVKTLKKIVIWYVKIEIY